MVAVEEKVASLASSCGLNNLLATFVKRVALLGQRDVVNTVGLFFNQCHFILALFLIEQLELLMVTKANIVLSTITCHYCSFTGYNCSFCI